MDPTYIIIWKARTSGRTGRGNKLMTQPEAEQIARELNHDYPGYQHLVLNTAGGEPAYSVEALDALRANEANSSATTADADPVVPSTPPAAGETPAATDVTSAAAPENPTDDSSPIGPHPLPEAKAA